MFVLGTSATVYLDFRNDEKQCEFTKLFEKRRFSKKFCCEMVHVKTS